MAINRVTYLDLSPEERREAAKAARQRLQTMMSNPFLGAEQVAYLHDQIHRVGLWEQGLLEVATVPADSEES